MDDEEERVALCRADDIESHRSFGGRGHCFAGPCAHRSTRQLEALLAGEEKPSLWPGVLVRDYVCFRAKVGFSDDDLVAGTRRNRRPALFPRQTFRPWSGHPLQLE